MKIVEMHNIPELTADVGYDEPGTMDIMLSGHLFHQVSEIYCYYPSTMTEGGFRFKYHYRLGFNTVKYQYIDKNNAEDYEIISAIVDKYKRMKALSDMVRE